MMTQLNIAAFTEAEVNWAADLFARTDPWRKLDVPVEKCREVCRDPAYQGYAARVQGQLCGALLIQKRSIAGSPYLRWIAVDAAHRGAGVGAAMMAFAEKLFQPEARDIFLCVSSFNGRAQEFYRRLGYAKVGEVKDLTLKGESEWIMHKRLV